MSKKGKFSFMVGGTKVTPQDLGLTEAIGAFDKRIGKGVYERDLPSRVVGQLPGKFGFAIPNPMSPTGATNIRFADLGFTERLGQMFGIDPMDTRGSDSGYVDAMNQIIEQDKESGRYNTSSLGAPTFVQDTGSDGIIPKISDKTIDTYEQFIDRTQNSPAMQAGVFDPKDLYQTYVQNQDFQAARGAGNLEEFAKEYPGSQTARRMRGRIPTSMDMGF